MAFSIAPSLVSMLSSTYTKWSFLNLNRFPIFCLAPSNCPGPNTPKSPTLIKLTYPTETAHCLSARESCKHVDMPRRLRLCATGTCFHVINRTAARLTLFEKQEDYEALERVLKLAHERVPLPIFWVLRNANPGVLSCGPKRTRQASGKEKAASAFVVRA